MTAAASPRIRWRGSIAVLSVGLLALASVVVFLPRFRERAVQVFVIVVGVVVIRLLVLAVVEATSRPGPFDFDRALVLPAMRPLATPSEPERIRFEVGAATHRSMELHQQFRRRMRRLAQDRLGAEHGVDMDAHPAASERLLGHVAWDLLRPDHVPPSDRFGPGMPVEDVTAIVTAVEELSR